MNCYFYIGCSLLGVVALFTAVFGTISSHVHKEMTVNNCDAWDYSSYKWFRINFARYEWEIDHKYGSVFHRISNSECHASIIRFKGRGMVLGPIDFFRSQRYLKKYCGSKREKGLWKESYQNLDYKTLRIIK